MKIIYWSNEEMKKINTVSTNLIKGIISLNEFKYIKDTINKENLVLISISEPKQNGYEDETLSDTDVKDFKDSIRVKFWDVEEDIDEYKVISDSVAKELHDFIIKNKNNKFLIHCKAGQSRSAGVGMAVECLINHDGDKYQYILKGSDITKNPRYSPNFTVYDKIVNSNE